MIPHSRRVNKPDRSSVRGRLFEGCCPPRCDLLAVFPWPSLAGSTVQAPGGDTVTNSLTQARWSTLGASPAQFPTTTRSPGIRPRQSDVATGIRTPHTAVTLVRQACPSFSAVLRKTWQTWKKPVSSLYNGGYGKMPVSVPWSDPAVKVTMWADPRKEAGSGASQSTCPLPTPVAGAESFGATHAKVLRLRDDPNEYSISPGCDQPWPSCLTALGNPYVYSLKRPQGRRPFPTVPTGYGSLSVAAPQEPETWDRTTPPPMATGRTPLSSNQAQEKCRKRQVLRKAPCRRAANSGPSVPSHRLRQAHNQ